MKEYDDIETVVRNTEKFIIKTISADELDRDELVEILINNLKIIELVQNACKDKSIILVL